MRNAQLCSDGHIVYMCRELNMQQLCLHVEYVLKKTSCGSKFKAKCFEIADFLYFVTFKHYKIKDRYKSTLSIIKVPS